MAGNLFGLNVARERPVGVPGPTERTMSHISRAARQTRDNNAARQYIEQAAGRFQAIGTPQAQQAAELIAKNPRAFAMQAEQFGGPAAMEQFYQMQAMQEQAGRAMTAGGSGNALVDHYQQTLGIDSKVALPLAKAVTDMQPKAQAQQLKQVFNPKTGQNEWRLVADAIGQRAPYKPGTSIRVGPDGTAIDVEGGSGSLPLTGGATTEFQKNVVVADDALSRIQGMRRAFHEAGGDDALKYTTQWWDKTRRTLHKLDVWELDPEMARDMSNRTAFMASALDNLNRTIKEITGAQMNKDEAQRIKPTQPNPDMSGPEFIKMMDHAEKLIRSGRDRRLYLLRRGMIGEAHDFNDEKDGIPRGWGIDAFNAKRNARAQTLVREYEAQFPDEDDRAITRRVSAQLERELQAGVPW